MAVRRPEGQGLSANVRQMWLTWFDRGNQVRRMPLPLEKTHLSSMNEMRSTDSASESLLKRGIEFGSRHQYRNAPDVERFLFDCRCTGRHAR